MRKIDINQEVLTTRQAGEALGVAIRTVQLWVEAGVLPAWRTAGGHRRIARSAVEKLARTRRLELAPEQAAQPTPEQTLKVLLIEEDPTMRHLFQEVARSWRFPVQLTTAENGFEGLVRMGALGPDVVITGLKLAGIDAFAMLHAFTGPFSAERAVHWVVVSSLSPQAIAKHGGLPKGVAHFSNPVHYGQLAEHLHGCLQRKRAGLPAHGA